jgi:hypothetical protein
MRWEPTKGEPAFSSFQEIAELCEFAWGRVLTGISNDPYLPGRYVLIFRDETDIPQITKTWFVFATHAERRAAEDHILGYGNNPNNDTQGAGVPTKPHPPRRPASNAVALEW